MMIAKDQNGQVYWIEGKSPRKELLEKLHSHSAQKMYIDSKSGESKHIGYIINGLWLTFFKVTEFVGE